MSKTDFKVGDRVTFVNPPAFVGQNGTVKHKLIFDPYKGLDYEYTVQPDGDTYNVPVWASEIE